MEPITESPTESTRKKIELVTFGQFADLARRRKLTVQSLSERFRGKIENPSEFFSRILSRKTPDLVIPYRSIVQFYTIASVIEPTSGAPLCACGCGAPVFDRKKWASSGCRTKARRKDVRNAQLWLGQLVDFVEPKLRQNRQRASYPLTSARSGENGL